MQLPSSDNALVNLLLGTRPAAPPGAAFGPGEAARFEPQPGLQLNPSGHGPERVAAQPYVASTTQPPNAALAATASSSPPATNAGLIRQAYAEYLRQAQHILDRQSGLPIQQVDHPGRFQSNTSCP
eukprot:EG_transcript_48016